MAMLTTTMRTGDNQQDGTARMESADRPILTDGSGPKAMISKKTVNAGESVLTNAAKRTQQIISLTKTYQPQDVPDKMQIACPRAQYTVATRQLR